MSATGFSAASSKSPRYYVLEVVRITKNADGDGEPETWVVASASFPDFGLAWHQASNMRERHPGRVFIAGELVPQYQPR